MALCPFANLEHLITIDTAGRSHTPVRVTGHTAWPGPKIGPLYPHGKPAPNGTYATFYIDLIGGLFQHRDTAYAARADGQGNFGSISVETADNRDNGPLNAAQLATFARLWLWLLSVHPTIPNQIARPGDLRGLAWHRLGIEGNFGPYNPGDPTTWCRAQTGAVWSTARGKTCPTDAKIRQFVAVQANPHAYVDGGNPASVQPTASQPVATSHHAAKPRAIPAGNYTAVPTPERAYTRTARPGRTQYYPADYLINDGVWGSGLTTSIQRWLRLIGYYPETEWVIDGDFGPATARALQQWLRNHGYYGQEYLLDGDFGTCSVIGLQSAMRVDGLYPVGEYVLDGVCGNVTLEHLQRWMAGDY